MEGVLLRPGLKADCRAMLQHMQSVAEHSQMSLGSQMTVQALEEAGFGDNPIMYSFVAEKESQVVGYIILHYTYSTWEGRSACMQDFYVIPELRGKGVGTALWKKSIQFTIKSGCNRFDLWALSTSVSFYTRRGAVDLTSLEGWHIFKMSEEVMQAFIKQEQKMLISCKLRPAQKEDCSFIINLIQELADYEKMPNGPKLSVTTLEEDGFMKNPIFECIIAEVNYKIVGYVIFFFTFTWATKTVYMEDLYVTPSCRGMGIGLGLWSNVIKTGLNKGCCRCEFSVLNWNAPSIAFYKTKGAEDYTELDNYHFIRLNREAMNHLGAP